MTVDDLETGHRRRPRSASATARSLTKREAQARQRAASQNRPPLQ